MVLLNDSIIKTLEKEYISFMGIESFPKYNLVTRQASLEIAEKNGYEIVASARTDTNSWEHELTVSSNLSLDKYLLFHEFTHILDTEMYANHDKTLYMAISGYTEYHASQVELLQLVGASSVSEEMDFSMNDIIDTIGGKRTIGQYVDDKYKHAIYMFSRNDFPADIASLKSSLGLLYNYWGLRSVCELFARDYTEHIENGSFMKYISTDVFCASNRLMHGRLDRNRVYQSCSIYISTIMPLIKEYRLT